MLIQFPIQVSKGGFRYLGIFVTPDLNSLFESNYSLHIQKVKNDLTKWASLPTSLLGRINKSQSQSHFNTSAHFMYKTIQSALHKVNALRRGSRKSIKKICKKYVTKTVTKRNKITKMN